MRNTHMLKCAYFLLYFVENIHSVTYFDKIIDNYWQYNIIIM